MYCCDYSKTLDFSSKEKNSTTKLVNGFEPFYESNLGSIFHADSLDVMKSIPDNSVNLVFTSPPYALHFKKEYGNVCQKDYVEWFVDFAKEIKRILTEDGSFVLNIGGSWNPGEPTRSIYHFKLVIALVEEVGFRLAQETFWYNPAKMPVPAQWVTVKRVRVKDSVEYVFWFSKGPHPKASNKKVLRPYSKDMLRLAAKGVKTTVRPSGHNINESFDKTHNGGSIPPNFIDDETPSDVLKMGNNAANDVYTKKCKANGIKIHPARFPMQFPEFFIKMLTDEGDLVLDPFGGSMTAGAVAESLNRRWIGIDTVEEYLDGALYRFEE
ncbi:TPA: site-specific DNA-methyltransferase [Salmonella enterica]|nr:site-specific DNA-methyltransferase [Salmonella enterica]